jgi:hypothetical protein
MFCFLHPCSLPSAFVILGVCVCGCGVEGGLSTERRYCLRRDREDHARPPWDFPCREPLSRLAFVGGP